MARPATVSVFDAFEALPDPAVILAADGAVVRANQAFKQTFRHWIGPERPPWGRHEPPPFRSGIRSFDAPAPDGRRFEWSERILPDGARFAVARDITRHVRAAEAALRAKTTLFATLTHELRTPLNGILGMAGLLEAEALEANEKTYVAAIKQSGEMLLDLITDVLEYARLDAGRIPLESAPFDPETTLQEIAELLSPKAHAKGLEIAVIIRGAPPARVLGDNGRLRQILFNLAGNAVKFTEAGGVTLELESRATGRLRVSVRDTGPGVPPDKQGLIFEEFAQADAGVARRHGGTGLGLAIVRRLAQAMGGQVGLASKVGEGACFWVELPLAALDAAGAPQLPPDTSIAVVSASPVLASALEATAASLGAAVANKGERADVILLDWSPDISEGEVAALRQNARGVVALIAQERRDDIAKSRAMGVAHYTLKPVRRTALAERIKLARIETKSAAPAALDSGSPLEGLRVLLAEDNPINALLARTLLERAGCAVTVVGDGEAAVSAAAIAGFDLIFLDIRMPVVDGVEAAERIRAGGGPSARAPIVALTADASEAERARALHAGMDDFLTKPVDGERLLAVAARFTDAENRATV
jgi:signal transduction histidine kinase/DNA-binding response OmpR family regulator